MTSFLHAWDTDIQQTGIAPIEVEKGYPPASLSGRNESELCEEEGKVVEKTQRPIFLQVLPHLLLRQEGNT